MGVSIQGPRGVSTSKISVSGGLGSAIISLQVLIWRCCSWPKFEYQSVIKFHYLYYVLVLSTNHQEPSRTSVRPVKLVTHYQAIIPKRV